MKKIVLLKKILINISENWPPANGILMMIENGDIDSETVNKVCDIVINDIKEFSGRLSEEQLSKSIKILGELKRLEDVSKESDQEELKKLDELLLLI